MTRPRRRQATIWSVGLLVVTLAGEAAAHRIYLATDDHTDYGWNASTAAYDQAMLEELDFYLGRVDATAAEHPDEQSRFAADCWWYLWLYEHNRDAAAFQKLVAAMRSGHITVPLNPFVVLYGAVPTELAIRAGYYPGRLERRYGLRFSTAQEMENATQPWGLASIWGRSRVEYTWKGICDCGATQAPFRDRTEEVFRWQGPDATELLAKWYQLDGTDYLSWGGYAEVRSNRTIDRLAQAVERFSAGPLFLPTALFGIGNDDVRYPNGQPLRDDVWQLVKDWNALQPGGDRAVVSNEVDYFRAIDAGGQRPDLPVLRGGWGNDWDMIPAVVPESAAAIRRATERLRGAELEAALVDWLAGGFWALRQPALESAIVDAFKFYEHSWSRAQLPDKKAWARGFSDAVGRLEADGDAALAKEWTTPAGETRFAAVNALGFARTDVVDVAVTGAGPFVVTDLATGDSMPSQVVARGGTTVLRVLARDVPSVGYRTYRYGPGTPLALPDAAVIDGSTIESARYRVTLGSRGELTSVRDKVGGRELVRAGQALNDFGDGVGGPAIAEDVGAVSATLRMDVGGVPPRRVRVTLLAGVDRIEITNEVLANHIAVPGAWHTFDFDLASPLAHFEEVGALASPGLVAQGGSFLPGTRADSMTLNHFVNLAEPDYNVTLSSWDAFAMTFGRSTSRAFDVGTSRVQILVTGNPVLGSTTTQAGGDDYLLQRFAVQAATGPYRGSAAMQTALAHQNPLHGLALPAGQQGGHLCAPAASWLSVDPPNVVVTAVKPAEEADRGMIVRLWELDGVATPFTIDLSAFRPTAVAETSLIETDIAGGTLEGSRLRGSIGPNEIKAYRFEPRAPDACVPDSPGTTTTSSTLTARETTTTTTSSAPAVTSTTVVSGTPASRCGDGRVDAGEACDPGGGVEGCCTVDCRAVCSVSAPLEAAGSHIEVVCEVADPAPHRRAPRCEAVGFDASGSTSSVLTAPGTVSLRARTGTGGRRGRLRLHLNRRGRRELRRRGQLRLVLRITIRQDGVARESRREVTVRTR